MKVRELIIRLQTLDPELPCVVDHFEDGMLDLEQVILDKRDDPPHDVVVGLYEAAPVAPTMPTFTVGQRVGEAEGDQALQIRIDEISEVRISATVVKLGEFYSLGHLQYGFVLGETLLFKRCRNAAWWVIYKPSQRPWFVLRQNAEGIATFEHYR